MWTQPLSLKLVVRELAFRDVRKDIVRIPFKFRNGISEGEICRLSTITTSKNVKILGKTEDPDDAAIYMDKKTRRAFALKENCEVDFRIKPVGWAGQMVWAMCNADTSIKIATQLALIALFFSVVSVGISLAGLPWVVAWLSRTSH